MAEAIYRRGQQEMVHYAHSSAVAEGEVLTCGPLIIVAPRALEANKEAGYPYTGEYEIDKDTSTAMAFGAKVDWDATANKLVATTAGDQHAGVVVQNGGAATADAKVRIRINVANQTA